MLLPSTIGHRPAAGHRNRPGLGRVSELSFACEYAMRTLLALVTSARSSAPVVATTSVACEQSQLDSGLCRGGT
jgi:hypothetical protein